MGLLFVHLSDLHIQPKSTVPLERIDALYTAISNDANRADRTFLILSGDLMWSGKEDEALKVIDFIEKIQKALMQNPKVNVEVLIVPGNHDCDFATETTVRKTLVEDIIEKGLSVAIDDDIINQCISIQSNVLQLKNYFEADSNRISQNHLASLHTFSDSPIRVVIRCLNTAWMSRIKDQPGRIVIPPSYIQECESDHTRAINVLVQHHPLHWFSPDQMRIIRQRCEEMSDIIIEGHEHEAAGSKRKEIRRAETTYLHGGIFYSPEDINVSTFNTLTVDENAENTLSISFTKYVWNRDHYERDERNSGTEILQLRSKLSITEIAMNEALRKRLDDPGAKYTHPRVGELRHGDIFVYPDLKTVTFNPRRASGLVSESLSGSEILHCEEHKPCRMIIIGQQKTGRTAFLRQLAKDTYSKGMLPVWLDGADLTSIKRNQIERKISDTFRSQYEAREEHMLQQHLDTKKVIIIDNIERSHLSTKYRLQLIDELAVISNNVVISASDTFQIEEMSKADGAMGKSLQDDYEVFHILEFGNLLRDKIIRKWILLGQEARIETNEFYRQVDQAKSIIDSVIGINLVPSIPFFLLTLLQTYEASTPHDLRFSSYGYYYELLIQASMQQLSLKPDQADAYHNYLAELAFHIFQTKTEHIAVEALRTFETRYAAEYRLYEDIQLLRNNLIKVSILAENSDSVSFRYRYIYYFFIAKYLSIHINEYDTKEIVINMASHPHVSIYANVLILLTYLSKEPYIVDTILATAKRVFDGIPEARLEEDIVFFNSLTTEIPKLVLESIKTDEARESALKAEDRSSSNTGAVEDIIDYTKDISELDFIAKINLAFKLTEILGQIAKSYYGSTKHQRKVEIIGGACESILRTLTTFFNFVQDNKEQLVSEVVEILKQHRFVDLAERERIIGFTKSFIFQVSGAVTYGFIRKVSRFIGSKTLSPSILVFLNAKNTVATKLIDKAIKLDYFGKFPFTELRTLGRQIEHNTLAYTVLRSLVINHLYMFDVGYKDRQRICEAFSITMADTRKIDFISRERKTG